MLVKLRGTRGTISLSSKDRMKYGVNTSCVEVTASSHRLFFDAGTGLASYVSPASDKGAMTYHIFLSHLHYDHITGLPFFKPLHQEGARVLLYGRKPEGMSSLEEAVKAYIRPPFLPFEIDFYKADIAFRELKTNTKVKLSEGLEIETFFLDHPGGALAYKLIETREGEKKSLVYATDSSELQAEDFEAFLEFTRGADLLLHDAFFTREEREGLEDGINKISWGHSSWEYVVSLGLEAKVKKLGLFHHLDIRTDAELEEIEKKARALLKGAFCAYDDQLIEL